MDAMRTTRGWRWKLPTEPVSTLPQLSGHWQRLPSAHPYLMSIGTVTGVTLLAWLLQYVGLGASIIPLYLIGVLICATSAGRGPAILSAVLSFLLFKFLFVPPIFTLTIDDTADVLQLGIFLVTALIGGGMAVRVREQALKARQYAGETTALYELSQATSTQLDFERIAPLIVTTTGQLLDCPACVLLVYERDGALQELARVGQANAETPGVEMPLRTSTETLGVLRVSLPDERRALEPDQQRLLETLAGQAALALERSRLAQAAAQAEVLAESDRLKSTLLAAVSHDFRTPLASITAAADELVAEDVQWSPAARLEFSAVIRAEAERLNRLVINLLDLTRLEAGVLRPQRGWYNIAEIVDGVLRWLAAGLADRPLEVHVPDDLPLLPVDYVQIEQVLWNVLQNALKYSPAGSPLMISAWLDTDALILHIADQGRGIPPTERPLVFEKFYRFEDPDQPRVTGSGVGLTICKGLVEGHGGRITLLEREGGGTVVEIRLPLQLELDESKGAV